MWKYALVVMGELSRYPCDANPRRVRQYVVGPVAVDIWCDDGLEGSYGQQLGTPQEQCAKGLGVTMCVLSVSSLIIEK